MSHYKFVLLFLLVVVAGSAVAQPGSFTINGSVDTSLKVKEIYFTQGSFSSIEQAKPQKIAVQQGKFLISGTLSEPGPAFLSFAENLNVKDPPPFKQFILDKGIISITITDKLPSASVAGSKANDDIIAYTSGQSPYMAKISALNEAAEQQSRLGVPRDSIINMYQSSFTEAGKELLSYQKGYVYNNPSAFISLLLLPEIGRATNNFFEIDSAFNTLNAEIRGSVTGKAISSYISKEKRTSIGAIAPEFALTDTSGKAVALSSFKGKYLLLDFWAAWCKPCRDENPNVVQAYQRFKDKGFTVLGVSLDRERKDWLRAINTDQLTWQHISDLKYFQSKAAVLYGVTSIPRNFLLDPQGKIIARDLRGPELQEKLDDLFKDQRSIKP